MSKCTKDNSNKGGNCGDDASCGGSKSCNSCNSSSFFNPSSGTEQNQSDATSDASSEVKHKRKSAAQKVVEGQ